MKLEPRNENELSIKARMTKLCRLVFLTLAIVGSIMFYYFQQTTMGGLGVSTSLFALVSFFHFNKLESRKSTMIDTKMTWFLLGVCILGLVLMIANAAQDGPDFYNGISVGMIFMGGLAYSLELVFTWLDNVK